MDFKNAFEETCHAALRTALDESDVELRHNYVLAAEFTPGKGVISFTGPPKKEIDVLLAKLSPTVTLLLSAKDLRVPASPSMVQEWGTVVDTMNEYSSQARYLGVVVSASGFSEGCPAWAQAKNIGLVPPYKGKTIAHEPGTILDMLARTVVITRNLLASARHALLEKPNFYWTVYKAT